MSNKKVLVVDDESELLELVKMRLEGSGFDVLTASDGMEGILKVQDEKPDLIILDVLMPNLDGRGFLEQLKNIEELKGTPVIIFTARPDMQELFEKEDIKHYIIKPYNADEFLKKINEIWGETNPIEYS